MQNDYLLFSITTMIISFQIDEGDNIWHPHSHYPDGIVKKLLEDYDNASDKFRHVLNCCHDSVNDKQIHIIIKYLTALRFAAYDTIFSKDDRKEILKDLYFHRKRQSVKFDKVIFSVNKNNWYKEERIVGIRVLDKKYWKVRRTIYSCSEQSAGWRSQQCIFDKKSKIN